MRPVGAKAQGFVDADIPGLCANSDLTAVGPAPIANKPIQRIGKL